MPFIRVGWLPDVTVRALHDGMAATTGGQGRENPDVWRVPLGRRAAHNRERAALAGGCPLDWSTRLQPHRYGALIALVVSLALAASAALVNTAIAQTPTPAAPQASPVATPKITDPAAPGAATSIATSVPGSSGTTTETVVEDDDGNEWEYRRF